MNLKSPPTIKYILYKINTHQFPAASSKKALFPKPAENADKKQSVFGDTGAFSLFHFFLNLRFFLDGVSCHAIIFSLKMGKQCRSFGSLPKG